MNNKSTLKKQNELYNKWGGLKQLTKDNSLTYKNSYEIYKQENEYYKQWLFYKNIRQAIKKEGKE